MWRSAVDSSRVNTDEPAPTYEADGITASLDMVLDFGLDNPDCAEEVDFQGSGDRCLFIQIRYDVAEDVLVGENSPQALVYVDAVITPDGQQVETAFADSAFPGTRDNIYFVILAVAAPGSTVKFSTGSNAAGFTTHTFEVPTELPPIYF